MTERKIQAQISTLVSQRDNALNTCVNLSGDLAEANETIADLEARIATLAAIVDAIPTNDQT